MRFLTFLTTLGTTCLASTTALAGNNGYLVDLNKTEIIQLPSAASAVVIGNSDIADVSVHAADTLFVVGRGFGETNLIVLDADGQIMMNADVRVRQTTPHEGVRVFNAKSRESYNCQPYCQPAPVLGDSPDFIEANTTPSEPIDPLTALFRAATQNMTSNNSSSSQPASPAGGGSFNGGPN